MMFSHHPRCSDAEAEAAVPGEVLLAQLVLLHLEALLQDLLKEWMNVGDVGDVGGWKIWKWGVFSKHEFSVWNVKCEVESLRFRLGVI